MGLIGNQSRAYLGGTKGPPQLVMSGCGWSRRGVAFVTFGIETAQPLPMSSKNTFLQNPREESLRNLVLQTIIFSKEKGEASKQARWNML